VANTILSPETFEKQASEVADILRALANERRLMILCKLVEWGEANVTSVGAVAAPREDAR
jgi:ArsR family transcriptional regulator